VKILLRSSFIGSTSDDQELAFRNYLALGDASLGFDVPEDNTIWEVIQNFARTHNHVPDVRTLRAHFEQLHQPEPVDRIEILLTLKPLYKGDFLHRVEERAEERRTRLVQELLREAGQIVSTGMEIKEGKQKKLIRGPIDAIRFLITKSHDIVMPATGQRLSGEITLDGEDFKREYDRIENDPLAGFGQHTGIEQIDTTLSGAKKFELWTHAAWTGGLKCVTGGTRLFDVTTGKLRTVKEIFDTGDLPTVHTLDETKWKMTTAQVSHVAESGVRPILKIESETGRSIRVSGNHPFRTPTGWVNAEDLSSGDWVAVPRDLRVGARVKSPFTDEEVAVLGYLIGDGGIIEDLTLTNSSVRCLKEMGIKEAKGTRRKQLQDPPVFRTVDKRVCKSDGRKHTDVIRVSRSPDRKGYTPSPVRLLLENLGLWGAGARDKHIPGDLWAISDDQVWVLLSALWATDGRIGMEKSRGKRKGKSVFSYGSTSYQLVVDLQALLQRVGVPSTVSKVSVTCNGEPYDFWSLLVTSRQGMGLFLSKISPKGKEPTRRKAEKWNQTALIKYDGDRIPASFLADIPDLTRFKTPTGFWRSVRRAKKGAWVSRNYVRKFAEVVGDEQLTRMMEGNVSWERVRYSTLDGMEMTYDMSVPGHANFVANGFITHNSSFAMNWAYNQAVYLKHDSLIFSLEMPYIQCRRILYAIHSMHGKFREARIQLGIQKDPGPSVSLDYGRVRDGQLTPEEKTFLLDYVIPDFNSGLYGKIHIEVSDPDKSDFNVADLRSRAEVIYSKSPFSLLIVDHAGLLAPRKWVPSTTERLNEILRDLKRLAMNFNRGAGMAVVNLFQISREGFKAAEKAVEKSDNTYTIGPYNLTFLSYCNEAERSSDIVTATYLDETLRNQNRVLFQCLKSRDQAPFKNFFAQVEWSCRRILTTHEVPMMVPKRDNDRSQNALDDVGDLFT